MNIKRKKLRTVPCVAPLTFFVLIGSHNGLCSEVQYHNGK